MSISHRITRYGLILMTITSGYLYWSWKNSVDKVQSLISSGCTNVECGWYTPILKELNDEEFTKIAYQTILQRKPDLEHMDLTMGVSRYSMLGFLMDSGEFRERILKMKTIQSKGEKKSQ